ncbi:hypothetical protein CDAR_417331 [Caerostris darwini]|uniref:Uncharacterized protein n=1 Tax=Caerostris darwini TaxID=1538125 RepID=A0AAV4X7C0_9ARAC|nr:hypothetical protein CDAR_417331 [Caerostris darwini]
MIGCYTPACHATDRSKRVMQQVLYRLSAETEAGSVMNGVMKGWGNWTRGRTDVTLILNSMNNLYESSFLPLLKKDAYFKNNGVALIEAAY